MLSGFDDKKDLKEIEVVVLQTMGFGFFPARRNRGKRRGRREGKRRWGEKGRGGGEKRVMPALRFAPSITYQVADSSPASSDTSSRKHYLTLQSCLGCHLQGT